MPAGQAFRSSAPASYTPHDSVTTARQMRENPKFVVTASKRRTGVDASTPPTHATTPILRYIHEPPLRDTIQLQLNRGKFRHILAKSLFFASQSSGYGRTAVR